MKVYFSRFFGIFLSSLLTATGLLVYGGTQLASAAPSPSSHQFLADVNGDGKADSIIITTYSIGSPDGPIPGHQWWVALSNGSQFATPTRWANFGDGFTRQFVADVNGDGKADAVTFDYGSGDWYVMPSNGTVFGNGDPYYYPQRWLAGHGVGSSNQFLSDINGDGAADTVVYFGASGEWWGATSNLARNGFDAPGKWFARGHGVGSSNQFLEDVNGDGKADAGIFIKQTGEWWVSNSDGIHFATGPNQWMRGHGAGSDNQLVADVTGDGKADAVAFFGKTGRWYVATSSGTGFNNGDPNYFPPLWISGHGYGSQNQLLGDTTGDGKDDSAVFFSGNLGNWYVAPSNGNSFDGGNPYFYPPLWISGHGAGT